MKGRWRIVDKKCECKLYTIKYIIMTFAVLHNICIRHNDPSMPRWKLQVEELGLIDRQLGRRESEYVSTSNARQMHVKCTSNARQMHVKCTSNARQMHVKCTSNARQMHVKCTSNARQMHVKCTSNARQMHVKCTSNC